MNTSSPSRAPAPAPVSVSSGSADGALPACHVLYVEDHPDTAMVFAKFLRRRLDLKVTVAKTLAEAVRVFCERARQGPQFDLLLTDLMLPDGNALTLPSMLREAGHPLNIPALSFSAQAREQDHRASRQAGFAEHICKPAQLDDVEAAIVRHLPTECRSAAPQVA